MNSVHYPARGKVKRRRAAGALRLRVRWWLVRLTAPLMRMLKSRRIYQGRRTVDREQAWRGSRALMRAARVAFFVGSVVFVLWVARALVVVIRGNSQGVWPDLDTPCSNAGFSCDTLNTFPGLFLPLLLAFVVFLRRLQRVQRPYVRKARDRPHEVVPTAGSMIDEVVGRDELCRVMIADLRDPHTRRPHMVTGAVGTGKTALLVQLTKLLARGGAIPVAVRLRDAQAALDFRELARRRFLADTDTTLTDDAEGERIWRHLCQDDKVVVLADGLEETLIEGDALKERDTLIRLAIRRANEDGLPVIIASRPHSALRGVEAAFVELEPLGEETALDYIQRASARDDERYLDWIVETAEVAETPLYLQITRQLHQAGLLKDVSPTGDRERLDPGSLDRAALRLGLLEVWTQGLINGQLPPELLLSPEDRQAIVEQLSALACIGLKQDRLYVSFNDLDPLQAWPGPRAANTGAGNAGGASRVRARFRRLSNRRGWAGRPHPAINKEVESRLKDQGRRLDLQLAGIWGTQLGLVETRGDGVRFPHSIVQASLGARLIHVAMADPRYRNEALKDPGRELLIALVLYSRAEARDARSDQSTRAGAARRGGNRRQHRELLRIAARDRTDVKALDLYAAALEIDSVDEAPAHAAIAEELQQRWPDIWAPDQRTLEEAKLNLVRRFGEAARQITERGSELAAPVKPAYSQLYRISSYEPSYPIRLAAAQEIGTGGDEAFERLEGDLGPPGRHTAPPAKDDGNRGRVPRPRAVRRPAEEDTEEERSWREAVTRAWLAPLLVGSVTTRRAGDARERLEQWLVLVGQQGHGRGEIDLQLSFEVALAQGFKYAANRRHRHPHARPHARAYLAEMASQMLKSTRFWYSRLALVHALCLWSLPDATVGQPSSRGRDADPKALVEHWVPLPGGWPEEHPLVVEARRLAMWAIETRQPERFIWIDESGIVARIGSPPARPGVRRKHQLWIPPSTGWTALHPRAQRLVADVLLLLNLAERGRRPSDREQRLQRTNSSQLPPCLTGDRSPLDPTRTLGMATTSEPGSNCEPGCLFRLCPYPLKSEQSYRAELSEAFCRRQHALVSSRSFGRRTAPWQEAQPGGLGRFWKQMGERARAQRHML